MDKKSIIVIIIVLVLGGVVIFTTDNFFNRSDMNNNSGESMMIEEEYMNSDETMMEEGDKMMGMEDDSKTPFQGTVLAGDTAKVYDFNQADYEKAVASNDLVVLYFYANWCPVCREEIPEFYSAFDELESDNVVGFRVSFNDNETDDHEENLAREHGVAYQHTKVFVKNGERVLKSPETWETQRYLEEINKFIK